MNVLQSKISEDRESSIFIRTKFWKSVHTFANSGGFAFLVFHTKSMEEHVHLQIQGLVRNPGIFKVFQADFKTNGLIPNTISILLSSMLRKIVW